MSKRLILHEKLCDILGSRNVYFQPPESKKLEYPCIIYSKAGMNQMRADNRSYRNTNMYEVIVIDKNPDSDIHEKIVEHFEMCSFDRGYPANNLNHYALTLYF